MSATLARRIRRIGILPTTYTETKEQILVKDEQGNQIAQDRIKRTPQRNRVELSLAELTQTRLSIIETWRNARKERQAHERKARKPRVKFQFVRRGNPRPKN